MKNLVLGILLTTAASCSMGGSIIIEPDAYAHGTDLTNISKYAQIRSTDGKPVYAQSLSTNAADGYDTKDLGCNVFGEEWFYHPDISGLEISFKAPVVSFSLLIAEVFPDAGPGSDPVLAYIYNTKNELISTHQVDEFHKRVDLGLIKGLEEINISWAYWTFEFSANDIGKVIIGGDSEPTTIDRLEFTYLEVPEPSPLLLYISALFLIGVTRKRIISAPQNIYR